MRQPSARQRGYRYSAGQAVADMPDVDAPPDNINIVNAIELSQCFVHSFGPEPNDPGQMIGLKRWPPNMRASGLKRSSKNKTPSLTTGC